MDPADITNQPVRIYPAPWCGYSVVFYHAYRPGHPDDRRGTIRELDDEACFWRITESKTRDSRLLTFATARERDDGLTLAQFGSLAHVRDELRALFA